MEGHVTERPYKERDGNLDSCRAVSLVEGRCRDGGRTRERKEEGEGEGQGRGRGIEGVRRRMGRGRTRWGGEVEEAEGKEEG